jgi:hypothetical protein
MMKMADGLRDYENAHTNPVNPPPPHKFSSKLYKWNTLNARSFPATGLDRPLEFQEVEAPEFLDNRHMKVVRLSALRTGRLYPQKGFLVLICVKRLSRPQGHNATGRIKLLKNSSDSIWNRTRDVPVCSAVPQPTAPPRTPKVDL